MSTAGASGERGFEDGRTLSRRLARARRALLWEAGWPLAWPLPALVAAFVAIALFDVLPLLPGWLHLAALVAFAVAFVALLLRLRKLRWPSLDAARRRVERDNDMAHGPLQLLADQVAAGNDDPAALALWQAYRRRIAALVGRLRPSRPQPVLARHDPYGLRFAALLALAIALAGAWQDGPQRLARAVSPNFDWLIGPPPVLQVWITPPDYTHIAPILLENLPADAAVKVPAGSHLLAELQGGDGAARVVLAGQAVPFEVLDADSQRLEMALGAAGGRLEVRQGWRLVASWEVAVNPDRAPTIAFASQPEADDQARVRFDVTASDDYGIAKARALIRRAGAPEDQPFAVDLPMGAGHPTKTHQSSWHDLTSNPLAGLPVTIEPEATNLAGIVGTGERVAMTLPERHFSNPVARAIIALRRQLAGDPGNREPVIDGLDRIASDPAAFGGDIVVMLALADSSARLSYDQSAQAVPSVLDTLWQTALRLEEGDKPAAERSLNEAAQALEKALDENAPEAEIDRLTEELKQAIARYLQAVAQQALRQGLRPLPPDANQRVVTPKELSDMLDQMQSLSKTGSRDAARQMLESLRQMLDNLRAGMPMGGSLQAQQQARQAAGALSAIARDQQALVNDTFRHAHQDGGRPGETGRSGPDQQGAATQEDIRHRLGDAMQMLGDMGADIPDSLGESEQAMREATQALNQGDLDGAVQAETQALSKLQEGTKTAMGALSKQMGQGGLAQSPGTAGRDPLGRPLNGQGMGEDNTVKIPSEADIQKARQVLEELRRRSGDAQRPLDERDYLQRLLKQF